MTKTWWNILGRRLFLYNNILIYILKQDFIKEFKSQQTTTQQKEESKEIEKIEDTIMAALILTDDGDRLLMLLRP